MKRVRTRVFASVLVGVRALMSAHTLAHSLVTPSIDYAKKSATKSGAFVPPAMFLQVVVAATLNALKPTKWFVVSHTVQHKVGCVVLQHSVSSIETLLSVAN